MLQWDEYWIAKVDQKTFSYDSIDCIVTILIAESQRLKSLDECVICFCQLYFIFN